MHCLSGVSWAVAAMFVDCLAAENEEGAKKARCSSDDRRRGKSLSLVTGVAKAHGVAVTALQAALCTFRPMYVSAGWQLPLRGLLAAYLTVGHVVLDGRAVGLHAGVVLELGVRRRGAVKSGVGHGYGCVVACSR